MAGHASGWVKVSMGKLKGQRIFISKAIKEKYKYKAVNSLNAAGDAQYGPIYKKIMASQPGGQAKEKIAVTVPAPAASAKKSPFENPTMPGEWPAKLAMTKASPGFNEVEEARSVLVWDGATAVKKPGTTYDQAKRFYARRDAVKAADATKMSSGKTVREEYDAFFATGGWTIAGTLPGNRLRLSGPNDSELVLHHVVAKNYAKVALNYGDLARNY